ncbi:hypothetical protein P261_01926 [Lachnospiraceae bacterium TWA4]|nr:hypothetical protein P261_01926 [Lachnospiraceae bacterium TWA4]
MEQAGSITYKCPNCGAAMLFDVESGQLKCDYCGTQIGIEDLAANTKTETIFSSKTSQEEGMQGQFAQYHCSTCGAEILTDENTTANNLCVLWLSISYERPIGRSNLSKADDSI